MKNNKINPELNKRLQSLQEVPSRDLQSSHAGRESFLAQAKTLKPYQPPAPNQTRRGRSTRKRSWVSRLAAVFAVLLVALTSLGGTVYAAQASLPDDLLYPVKTLTEDIQVSLENDPEDRINLHTSFVARRLDEIKALLDAGEPVSQKALNRLQMHTQKMLQEAAQIGEGNMELALLQVQQSLQLQNQVMTKLQKQTPGGSEPGLVKSQEEVQSRLRLVESGINEPQGFQEQIRNENSDTPGQGNNEGNGKSNKPETPPGQENKENNGNSKGNNKGNN